MQKLAVWVFKHPVYERIFPQYNSDQAQNNQYDILLYFKQILKATNDPLYNSNYFWDWLYA